MRAWIVCFALGLWVSVSACIVTEVPLPRWDATSDRDELGDVGQLEASNDAVDATAERGDTIADQDSAFVDRADATREAGAETGLTICGRVPVDTRQDNNHCGGCGITCSRRGVADAGISAMQCENSICRVVGCFHPYIPNVARTTCVCPWVCTLPNAVAECREGPCVISRCLPWFGDCDGRDENGCETDLLSDANCGACGNVCPTNTPCGGGSCCCAGCC